MALSALDWSLIVVYFLFSFGIAIYYYRRAGKNTSEFFLSGRNMPWWLAGTSMVARSRKTPTCFSPPAGNNKSRCRKRRGSK